MKSERFKVDGHECFLYSPVEEAFALLLQLVDEHDLRTMDNELELISKSCTVPFKLLAISVNDWQKELTPWSAPAVFGKVPFGDGAPGTLDMISGKILPEFQAERVILGGYSLAGLFALWAGYNSKAFDAIAAASPSVWYPGWMEYAKTHSPECNSIYLSLGDKEEKTKNPIMSTVGDCIRGQFEILKHQGIETKLEWNEGNHFTDPDIRMAKAFASTLSGK